MKLSDGYAMVMKAEGCSLWEENPALEVCEAALVSCVAPISFRHNLGMVKVKEIGDACYPSLLRD
ncbi:hypothetical protein F2Q69_00021590 [Brassica cretica]|uniref:Uncharacterized protein n=1 Tax=Brassica cretica TaxID=69181 RepID=A0A8S9QF47_BRACR|nr:hypothetical protein F2Q69_00021590 [Brassica cretica]